MVGKGTSYAIPEERWRAPVDGWTERKRSPFEQAQTCQSHLQVEVPVDPPAATPIAATASRAPPSAYGLCADLGKRHASVAKHRLGRDQVAPIGKRMTNVICKVHGTGIGMTTVANAVRRPWQAPRS